MNNKIEIVLTFSPSNDSSNYSNIKEEDIWIIMTAAKSLIESRNTITEILGDKAQDFINNIIKVEV